MSNLYILVGPNFYDVDIYLSQIKSEHKDYDISYFSASKSMGKKEISFNLSLAMDNVIKYSDDSIDALLYDDDDEVTRLGLTIFNTSDTSCILQAINSRKHLSDSNKLVIICPNKPSNEASKAIEDIDDEHTKVVHFEQISSEHIFRKFCSDVIDKFGIEFEDEGTLDYLLDLLEHECCFIQTANWDLESIDFNSSFSRKIVYNKGLAFRTIDSIHSYSDSPSKEDLKDFFALKERNSKRQLLLNMLYQDNSFEAADVLREELYHSDLQSVRSFMGYFCFCLEEYVKCKKHKRRPNTSAAPFANKKCFKIHRHRVLLQELNKIRENYYNSKESLLTSFCLELHKASL